MYNRILANDILAELDESFPTAMTLDELRAALPECSHIPKQEWLTVIDALDQEGLVGGIVNRASSGLIEIVGSLVISKMGRQELKRQRLENYNTDIPRTTKAARKLAPAPAVTQMLGGNKIFIVHGHDSGLKETVARFITQLSFEPVILHEKPNEGNTIIEKFEQHSEGVIFAIVLLTPDDTGGPVENDPSTYHARARQNVILELGYFLGSLKRRSVCALYSEGVELPSDMDGLIYIPIDKTDGWRLKLAREIRASGVAVDLNKAI